MNHFLLFLLICLSLASDAQNLVPNGSFEQFTQCPSTTDEVGLCIGWYKLLNSPDYFATCSAYPVSIPDNVAGFQSVQFGNAYVGLFTYTWSTFYREIIGAQLLDTLIPGNTYHVSMRVSRGNWTYQANNNAASNRLGILFSGNQYTLNNPPPVNNFSQIYVDSIITDTVNWILLHWNFMADSAYSYAYIGNFFDDANTDTLTNGPYPSDAYYFIDSVNVICSATDCISGIHQEGVSNALLFNAQTEEITISSRGNLKMFNVRGQLLLNANVPAGNLSLSGFSRGMYFIIFSTSQLSISKKIIF